MESVMYNITAIYEVSSRGKYRGETSGVFETPEVYFLFLLLPHNAVFPHPGAKGACVDAQDYCCSVFPLDSPTGFQEHIEDMVVFQLNQGFDIISW